MTYNSGQLTVSTTATFLVRAESAFNLTVSSDTASTNTAFICLQPGNATAATASTTTGCPLVPGGTIALAGYPNSGAVWVSAVTGASSASTIGWCLSTGQ